MKLIIDIGNATPEKVLAAMAERPGLPAAHLTVGYQVFGVNRVEVVPEPKALTFGTGAVCDEPVEDDEDDEGPFVECRKPSRFAVTRSDGDTRFGYSPELGAGFEESCEQHLAGVIAGMVNGDEGVSAVVSIRWDADRDANG